MRSRSLRELVFSRLWSNDLKFFEVLARNPASRLCDTRELLGYTPWAFNLPEAEHSEAWKFLMDSKHFYAPYGPTTTEQCSSGFKITYQGHECQWNGPSWPYATSMTLTGLANLLNDYSQEFISKDEYFRLLKYYSESQKLLLDNGSLIPWIDENLNPFTGDWISRTRLKTWQDGTWSQEKGGVERGKDYNHSTFCDLIISGLIGLRPQPDNALIINPLISEDEWDYFCLENILYHGKTITIMYDKGGGKYKMGKGLKVWVDGKLLKSSPKIEKVIITKI